MGSQEILRIFESEPTVNLLRTKAVLENSMEGEFQ